MKAFKLACLALLVVQAGCAWEMEQRHRETNKCARARIEEIDKACKGVDSPACRQAYLNVGNECGANDGPFD